MMVIFSLLLAVVFFLLGWQFRRGKWLRAVAGNTFGELPREQALKVGRSTGLVLYYAGGFCLFTAYYLQLGRFDGLFYTVFGITLVLALGLLVSRLKVWVKEGR